MILEHLKTELWLYESKVSYNTQKSLDCYGIQGKTLISEAVPESKDSIKPLWWNFWTSGEWLKILAGVIYCVTHLEVSLARHVVTLLANFRLPG